jgi:hypothetical protein
MTTYTGAFKKNDKVIYTSPGSGHEIPGTVAHCYGLSQESMCYLYNVVFDQGGYGHLLECDLAPAPAKAVPIPTV